MRKFVLAFVVALIATVGRGFAADANPSELWQRANNAYERGEYESAAALYEQIAQAGYADARLFYNLGNAYYKLEQTGKAVLNYNRALRLDPSDENTKANLNLANARTVDNIDQAPVFFLKRWIVGLRQGISSNQWAVVSIALFVLMLAALLLFLLSPRLPWRKTGFWGAMLCAAAFAFAVIFSSKQKAEELNPCEAIVMNTAAPVKSSPDYNSTDIFLLHEGTKVRLVRRQSGWFEIRLANGSVGWIEEGAVEVID